MEKTTKPQLPRGTISFILLTAFLNLAGIGLVNPVLPAVTAQYVPQSQVDFMVALLFTSYSLCQFLAVPTLGALSDRYGRRPILLISLLGSAAGYFLFGIAGALWMLFAGRMIDGLTGGNIATIYAYAADITEPRERTKFFGLLGASAGMGFVIGPALGGLIYRVSGGSLSAPLFFASFVTVLNTIWGYFVMPESLTDERRAEYIPLARLNPFSQLLDVFKIAYLRMLLVGILLWVIGFAILQSNLGALTESHLGWSPDATSAIFFVVGIIGILVQGILIPRLLPRFGEIKLAIGGLISMGFGLFLLGIVAATFYVPLLFIAVVFIASGNGLITPSLTGLLSQSVSPREQGRVQGGNQSIQALARVLGPLWVVLLTSGGGNLPIPYFTGAFSLIIAVWVVVAAIPQLQAHHAEAAKAAS